MMPGRVSVRAKQKLVARYQSGESVRALCLEAHVARSTFYYWAKLYHVQVTDKGNVVTPKEFHALTKRLKKCEEIIGVLRSVDCLLSAPLRERLAAAESLTGQYSKHSICDALNIPRGTFYNHILRNKRGEAMYVKRRESLRILVKDTFDNSHQIFGVGKIQAVLARQGHTVSRRMVSSLMREMGLYSIRMTSKSDYLKLRREERKVDLLKRNFNANAPDKVWVSDITCLKVRDRYYYLCAIIDLYSRKVLAHALSRSNSTRLAADTLRQALQDRQPKGAVLHSDRGSPYISYTFQKLLNDNAVAQSFSRPGHPCDNAVAESFFASVKKEEYYRSTYKSESELRERIGKYIVFYNTKRPHSALGNRIPDDVDRMFNNTETAS
jgi:transposase InsO family protein